MKQKKFCLLFAIAIIIAMLNMAMEMPSYAIVGTDDTPLISEKGGDNSSLATGLHRFASRLTKLIPLKKFKPFKHFKAFDKFTKSKKFISFPQPETRRSRNGFLNTILKVKLGQNLIRDPSSGQLEPITSPTYEGRLIGPTLRVKPGDTMFINIPNRLPENPQMQRKGPTGAFPHDPFTTNLHTHGLTVSPEGISDNILRQMEPNTISPVRIHIPEDHPSGTFWYHPHKHGSVSYQFFGGMAGFLIIEGGPGTLDHIPSVKAAKDVVMGFQVIRTDTEGKLPFVNQTATSFSSFPGKTNGLWSAYLNTWDPNTDQFAVHKSNYYLTTNGKTQPILHMQPGEVQRWRLLNAGSGVTLIVGLQEHVFHLIAIDGITLPNVQTIGFPDALVLGAGNRMDVMIKAGKPGIYLLQALNPTGDKLPAGYPVIPGVDETEPRNPRLGFDFPFIESEGDMRLQYPYTLAIIVVSGEPKHMALPSGPLPLPSSLPPIQTMLEADPDVHRNVAFEICGNQPQFAMKDPSDRLDSCGWYFNRYNAEYWGSNDILGPEGLPFNTLLMMRDADDVGVPNPIPNPEIPRIDYQKEGLFTKNQPLFIMHAGNIEEWTIYNRSFADHPFHLHVNPVLITHINGIFLKENVHWRDTIIVPSAQPQPTGRDTDPIPITDPSIKIGSVTFRTRLDPDITGGTVMHCHVLQHEDLGMMQLVDITN